jgi:uncharacterized protein YbjT (DUF2867 family)
VRVLLTGATGYVGGRLLPALEAEGHQVRCLARNPGYLAPRVGGNTEVVGGDLLDPASIADALQGVEAAYYLAHALGSTGDFEELEHRAARNFGEAAKRAGVKRIIYLGGLGHGEGLSRHLASRQETGRILAASGVPCIELRASIVLGSGSLSFALLRSLVEKLPVMVTPRWVTTPAQPIAIRDVLSYLVQSLTIPCGESVVYEIGGPDQVSYGDLMRIYGEVRGLRRLLIPVPVLTPRLSSLWLGLVTPLYARVGRKLIESLRNETIVLDDSAQKVFDVTPIDARTAIERALRKEEDLMATTRWSDAISSAGEPRSWHGVAFGERLIDSRSRQVDVTPAEAFRPIERIGGDTGWYYANWLWRVRGVLDLLVGGVGMRRGRRDPDHLQAGDPLDFWRVERIERGKVLRLQAEMKLPGRAWLQYEVEPTEKGSEIRQTAIFDPLGLFGRLYWFALLPIHELIFGGMLRRIAKAANRADSRIRD